MQRLNASLLQTLVIVLGLLAGLAMVGFIGLTLKCGCQSGEALLGICLAIVGYLGGLVTPTPSDSRA